MKIYDKLIEFETRQHVMVCLEKQLFFFTLLFEKGT